jgi:hypothetical protein
MKTQDSKQGLIERQPPCLEKNELFERLLEVQELQITSDHHLYPFIAHTFAGGI